MRQCTVNARRLDRKSSHIQRKAIRKNKSNKANETKVSRLNAKLDLTEQTAATMEDHTEEQVSIKKELTEGTISEASL